jgi:hypothetical protein
MGPQVHRDHPMCIGEDVDVVAEEHARHADTVDQWNHRPGSDVDVGDDRTVSKTELVFTRQFLV